MNDNFDIIENGVLIIKGNKIIDLGNEKIIEKYRPVFGKPRENEIRAWNNSMQYMYKVLMDGEIPNNTGVLIERSYLMLKPCSLSTRGIK